MKGGHPNPIKTLIACISIPTELHSPRMQLHPNLIRRIKIDMFKRLFSDTSAELDEKALLIALFVIAAIVGLSPLGAKVAQTFQDVAAAI